MKYNISHIDTCSSQYFSGHHLPVVQVLVDENTTYAEIKARLLESETVDHLFDDTRFGNENISSNEGFDYSTYKAAVEKLFSNFATLDYVPDSLYEIGSMDGEDGWDCYMYFVVEPVKD